MKTKILVTGSSGFVGGYIVEELLKNNYQVIGIDNNSKYGKIYRNFEKNSDYIFHLGDCKDVILLKSLIKDCEYVIAGAAMIGGISYFHKFAYDLLSENERITAATFDAAINEYKNGNLKKIIVISSSMVFESTTNFPSKESDLITSPPPLSTYGFQKLSTEFFAKGAYEQYGLPFTIVRPFNCIGIGEGKSNFDSEIYSGNVKLALSHVLPDIIQKILKGQNPLHILGSGNQIRHYTDGKDLARGIRLAIESPNAINQDFNISTSRKTSVIELAEIVWKKINKNLPFSYVSDDPFTYDVQLRSPDTTKAKELLDFETKISLEDSIDEVIDWIRKQILTKNF